jgi:hypothetical protein
LAAAPILVRRTQACDQQFSNQFSMRPILAEPSQQSHPRHAGEFNDAAARRPMLRLLPWVRRKLTHPSECGCEVERKLTACGWVSKRQNPSDFVSPLSWEVAISRSVLGRAILLTLLSLPSNVLTYHFSLKPFLPPPRKSACILVQQYLGPCEALETWTTSNCSPHRVQQELDSSALDTVCHLNYYTQLC